MPQKLQSLCSVCGKDIEESYPDSPVRVDITVSVLGDTKPDFDFLPAWVVAFLSLRKPRIELCPGCAANHVDIAEVLTDAIVDTGVREEKARTVHTPEKETQLNERQQGLKNRLSDEKSQRGRRAANQTPLPPLLIGDAIPARPKDKWHPSSNFPKVVHDSRMIPRPPVQE
jgi:hypothetical protein